MREQRETQGQRAVLAWYERQATVAYEVRKAQAVVTAKAAAVR